jgi:hypothetical protein
MNAVSGGWDFGSYLGLKLNFGTPKFRTSRPCAVRLDLDHGVPDNSKACNHASPLHVLQECNL